MTGGGSGGHITPLLSLARALKKAKPGCWVVYIGHKGDKFDRHDKRLIDFNDARFISAGKYRRYHNQSTWSKLLDLKTFLLNARDFLRVFTSTVTAYHILSSFKPDVVFSKGGFVALPVGIAAKVRGVPVVTHDSDASPGLANRIIGRWAVIHATALPPEFYDYPKASTSHVGVPIDDKIQPVDRKTQAGFKKSIGLAADSSVLLISGGGLGSKRINQMVLAIAPKLLATRPDLQMVHFTGPKSEAEVNQHYKGVLDKAEVKRIKVIGFSDEFYKFVGAADLIVARAGATSLAEFAAAGKACILIPSPFLAAGHQMKNAELLMNAEAVEVVDEEASTDELLAKIDELLDNDEKRETLAANLAITAKLDAAKELASILLDVATKKLK